ncbi:zinc ribbon domain-containing protein [Paenibacillus dakarensis]|uniref:zinc ribbon domain-containing protein n=1 Tax=Paenibacillus dakarensis TaxID=1527293 RepID=UPI0006D5313B|nr:zinc ribbon domain-containing protein [Paenibacillus dakarensis]
MFCSKCGASVSSEAGFCGACGNAIHKNKSEIEVLPVKVEQDNSEVSATSEIAVQHEPVLPGLTGGGEEVRYLKFLKRYRTAFAGVLGAAILAAVLYFAVMPLLFQEKEEPVIFMGNNELFLHIPSQKEPVELSRRLLVDDEDEEEWDNYGSYYGYNQMIGQIVKISEDKSKLFFINRIKNEGTANLYYRDLKKKASSWKDEQAVNLATNISSLEGNGFTISSTGQEVLYVKRNNDEYKGKLYLHNLSDETVIDTRVTNYWYADAKSVIYYTKRDDNEEQNLYVVNTSKLDDKIKVDSNVNNIVQFDSSNGNIYYTKNDSSKNVNSQTLYSKELNEDKEKLISNIDSIVSDIKNKQFYYTVAEEKEFELYSLVEDDMAESDGDIAEPLLSDYESLVNTPYTDYWSGETYYEEELVTDYDSYNIAYDIYSAKMSRDQLRQSLKEESVYDVSLSLYLFSEGKANKVTDGYYSNSFNDPGVKTIFYSKNERGSMKKLYLSEIGGAEEVRSEYEQRLMQSTVTYMSSGQVHDTSFLKEGTAMSMAVLSSDEKQLYFIESTESNNELVSYEIIDGKPTNRKRLDEDVEYFNYIPTDSTLFYYKEVHDDAGELYQYADGESKRISIDVKLGYTTYYPEDKTLLYMKDYYDQDGTGDVYRYKNKESVKIAGDAGAYYYNGPTELYYLDHLESDRTYGKLNKYEDKGKSVEISDRVYSMFSPVHRFNF